MRQLIQSLLDSSKLSYCLMWWATRPPSGSSNLLVYIVFVYILCNILWINNVYVHVPRNFYIHIQIIGLILYSLLLILYAHVYLCIHTNIHIHICIQVNYAMFFQLPMILNSHFDSSTANVISALYSVGMMPGMYVYNVYV